MVINSVKVIWVEQSPNHQNNETHGASPELHKDGNRYRPWWICHY